MKPINVMMLRLLYEYTHHNLIQTQELYNQQQKNFMNKLLIGDVKKYLKIKK